MSTLEVGTIAPISGSNDVTLGGSSKNIKFASGTTVDFSTNTPTTTLSSTMKMVPAFEAKLSGSQAISNSTNTKAAFNTENFDTDSCYDTSNYKFTPNVAGKYYVYVSLYVDSMVASNFNNGDAVIKKNGSTISNGLHNFSNNPPKGLAIGISTILDMNGSSDYVEIFGSVTTINNNGGQFLSGDLSVFGAYKVIGA